MLCQIFEKFDTDKDGILNLKARSLDSLCCFQQVSDLSNGAIFALFLQEFNELQVSTEGGEAMYNSDQLKASKD